MHVKTQDTACARPFSEIRPLVLGCAYARRASESQTRLTFYTMKNPQVACEQGSPRGGEREREEGRGRGVGRMEGGKESGESNKLCHELINTIITVTLSELPFLIASLAIRLQAVWKR